MEPVVPVVTFIVGVVFGHLITPQRGAEAHAVPSAPSLAEFIVLELDVGATAYERDWSNALARRTGGAIEVTVAHGRADVVTATQAIELDWAGKCKEGLGQAIYYAHARGKRPVVALIGMLENEVIEFLLNQSVDVIVLQ